MSFRVDLFLETASRAPKMKTGLCGWVIEFKLKDGRIVTRNGVVREESTTGNRIHIKTLTEALRNLKPGCQITVHTYSTYLESLITEWIDEWGLFGWRKSRNGERVRNADLLPDLLTEKLKHTISFDVKPRHIYTEWLKSEMKE